MQKLIPNNKWKNFFLLKHKPLYNPHNRQEWILYCKQGGKIEQCSPPMPKQMAISLLCFYGFSFRSTMLVSYKSERLLRLKMDYYYG